MKIYLSKSNNCDYDQLLRTRSIIKNKFGCELVEYVGGEYSPEPMYECDILFVLPPKIEGRDFYTGKGQYDTINYWRKKNGKKNVWFIADSTPDHLVLDTSTLGQVVRKNWQTEYCKYMMPDKRLIVNSMNFASFVEKENTGLTAPVPVNTNIDILDKYSQFDYDIIL